MNVETTPHRRKAEEVQLPLFSEADYEEVAISPAQEVLPGSGGSQVIDIEHMSTQEFLEKLRQEQAEDREEHSVHHW